MPEKPHAPRPPIVPRLDLSAPPPPLEERVEATSLRAPKSTETERIEALEQAMIGTQTRMTNFEARLESVSSNIGPQIDSSVKASLAHEMTGVNNKLDAIGLETFNQSGFIKRTLEIVKRDRQDSISDAVEELTLPKERQKLSAAEQKLFDGKGRRIRLWLKSAGVVVFIAVVVGSALGINRCNHVHGVEIPD